MSEPILKEYWTRVCLWSKRNKSNMRFARYGSVLIGAAVILACAFLLLISEHSGDEAIRSPLFLSIILQYLLSITYLYVLGTYLWFSITERLSLVRTEIPPPGWLGIFKKGTVVNLIYLLSSFFGIMIYLSMGVSYPAIYAIFNTVILSFIFVFVHPKKLFFEIYKSKLTDGDFMDGMEAASYFLELNGREPIFECNNKKQNKKQHLRTMEYIHDKLASKKERENLELIFQMRFDKLLISWEVLPHEQYAKTFAFPKSIEPYVPYVPEEKLLYIVPKNWIYRMTKQSIEMSIPGILVAIAIYLLGVGTI